MYTDKSMAVFPWSVSQTGGGQTWHVGPGVLTVVNHEELKKQ